MDLTAPTVQSLMTVAGAAILTGLLMEYVVFRILGLAPATQDRYGPFLAILVGVIVVEIATFTIVTGPSRLDVVQGAVNGIVAGLLSIGIHSVAKRVVPGS